MSPKSQPVFQNRLQSIAPAQSTIPAESVSSTSAIPPEIATEHSMMDSHPSQASFSPTSMNHLFQDVFGNATFESEISMWLNNEDLGNNPTLQNFDPYEPLMFFQLPDGMVESNATEVHHYRPADGNPAIMPKEDLLRQKWFNFVGVQSTGYSTPDDGAERSHIDENFMKCLYQRLHPPAPDRSLPSADFLVSSLSLLLVSRCSSRQNSCLQMFVTRFNPIFPIIHVQTFRLSSNKPLLLMAMCTLGSLFLGSPQAKNMGQKMFDRLHKASLASVRIYCSEYMSQADS